MTTEAEILTLLRESYRRSAAECDLLAKGSHGHAYKRLGKHLLKAEGCARQMAMWRFQAEWLPIMLQLGTLRTRMNKWEGEEKEVGGLPVWQPVDAKTRYIRYTMLAALMRQGEDQVKKFSERATGRASDFRPPKGTLILPEQPALLQAALPQYLDIGSSA
jgi:hypothetical protein